ERLSRYSSMLISGIPASLAHQAKALALRRRFFLSLLFTGRVAAGLQDDLVLVVHHDEVPGEHAGLADGFIVGRIIAERLTHLVERDHPVLPAGLDHPLALLRIRGVCLLLVEGDEILILLCLGQENGLERLAD